MRAIDSSALTLLFAGALHSIISLFGSIYLFASIFHDDLMHIHAEVMKTAIIIIIGGLSMISDSHGLCAGVSHGENSLARLGVAQNGGEFLRIRMARQKVGTAMPTAQ